MIFLKIYSFLYARTCMIAPYTDTTLWPTFNIAKVPHIKYFSLGFVVADKEKDPSWGGYYKVDSNFYSYIINQVRKKGGDVICSFGGAEGNELAVDIKDSNKLAQVYSKVIEKYDFKYIDFDIEGKNLYNQSANARRGFALIELLKKHPDLYVSLTVPVSTRGLNDDTLELISITPHKLLNIMAMDFGNEKNMFKAVVNAIEATRKQTKKHMGVTVMIGKNDTPEIFTLEDAKKLKEYIKQKAWIKRLSFWSIERDQGVHDDHLSKSSQVDQKPFEYSKIFIGKEKTFLGSLSSIFGSKRLE